MLLRYPAGSTCGSGALGRAILGIVGGMDILEKPGVAGDLRDDSEDMEPISAREEEFLRESPEAEVAEPDLGLREKRPMVIIVKGEKWDVDYCCVVEECNGEDWIGWTRFGGHDKTFLLSVCEREKSVTSDE
jgi:hypothetical protein